MTKRILKLSLRSSLICCILLLANVPVCAQWSAGVTAGYSRNTLDINPGYAYDMRYRAVGGLTVSVPVRYQFADWFALRAEVSFIEKGYRMERSSVYEGIYNELNNSYLQLPIMASFSFGGERLRGFFNAGGYIGYWLNSHINGANLMMFPPADENMPSHPGKFDYYDEKVAFDSRRDNRFEAGLLTGAGISYRLSPKIELLAEARYYYALTDIQKEYMRNLTPRYNNTWAVQIGCMISFGSKK